LKPHIVTLAREDDELDFPVVIAGLDPAIHGKGKRAAGGHGLPGLRPVMTKKERSERNKCRKN
jgi:hypothetical protein